MIRHSRAIRMHAFIRRIRRDQSGLALIEMAYAMPILLVLTMGGAELANYATVQMRVSQLAVQVADNASRMGSGQPLAAKVITETMINDVLTGAEAQASDLNLMSTQKENGTDVQKARIVLSDLEPKTTPVNTTPPKFMIVWQRCRGGATSFVSRYGTPTTATNIDGMGPGTSTQKIGPPDGTKMMFVEVHYRYQPLFIGKFGFVNYVDIDSEAAMLVRDDRAAGIGNPDGVTASTC